MLQRRLKTKTLVVLGAAGLAILPGVRLVLEHGGRATSASDFALGALFGVSIGLLLLALRLRGREARAGYGPDRAG